MCWGRDPLDFTLPPMNLTFSVPMSSRKNAASTQLGQIPVVPACDHGSVAPLPKHTEIPLSFGGSPTQCLHFWFHYKFTNRKHDIPKRTHQMLGWKRQRFRSGSWGSVARTKKSRDNDNNLLLVPSTIAKPQSCANHFGCQCAITPKILCSVGTNCYSQSCSFLFAHLTLHHSCPQNQHSDKLHKEITESNYSAVLFLSAPTFTRSHEWLTNKNWHKAKLPSSHCKLPSTHR